MKERYIFFRLRGRRLEPSQPRMADLHYYINHTLKCKIEAGFESRPTEEIAPHPPSPRGGEELLQERVVNLFFDISD